MSKVFLICGKICSGKSTYAEQLRVKNKAAILLSVDEIMLSIFGKYVGERHDEYCENVQKYLFNKSLELSEIGVNVIFDWGFWQKNEREFAKEFYKSRDIECELHYLDIIDELWKKRIEKRNNAVLTGDANTYYIDEGLARKFAAMFEPPSAHEIDFLIKGDEQ